MLTPGDPGFAEELLGFNLTHTHRPQLVAPATSVADVQAAVRDATGVHVTVLATGHGADTPITDGLVITLRRLNTVTIDPDARTATFGGGVRWAAVIEAAAAFGLAPITGSSPNVGATGYLLGGGLGPLARSHGFSSDYVVGFTLVDARGELVRADADTNPDLYWALRGGKGGFGVVLETSIRLVQLATVYGGSLIFAEPDIETVLRGWIDWTTDASADVTTSVAIVRFPPLEEVPEQMRGQTVLMLRFAYPGSAAEGEALAAPLATLATPLMDTMGELPVAQIGMIHNDPVEPAPGWGRGMLLNALDGDFATAMLEHVGAGVRTPLMIAEVRHIGAATRRDVPEGSAVGGRGAGYTLHLIGVPDPTLFGAALPAVADRLQASIASWIAPETTINFADEHDPIDFRRAWPTETFERLDRLRATWDPQGVFAYGPART